MRAALAWRLRRIVIGRYFMSPNRQPRRLALPVSAGAAAVAAAVATTIVFSPTIARAAPAPVGIGTAGNFSVLAATTVTNTGDSTLEQDLGLSPGPAITGFPPGEVQGAIHIADAVALQAQTDLTTAYNDAAGRTPPTDVPNELGGTTSFPVSTGSRRHS